MSFRRAVQPPFLPVGSGGLLINEWGLTTTGVFSAGTDSEFMTPIFVPNGIRINALGIRVTAAGGAGCIWRLGLRRSVFNLPGELLVEPATQALGDVPAAYNLPIPDLILSAGWYWTSAVQQVAASAGIRYYSAPNTTLGIADSASASNAPATCRFRAGVPGAIPVSPGVTAPTTISPMIWLRVA